MYIYSEKSYLKKKLFNNNFRSSFPFAPIQILKYITQNYFTKQVHAHDWHAAGPNLVNKFMCKSMLDVHC